MSSVVDCLNKAVAEGYVENFKVDKNGLFSSNDENNKHYNPRDVEIVNFYRFEGASDPADNTILYVISTNDGTKGTISDAYGAYGDELVTSFMQKVEEITKKKGS